MKIISNDFLKNKVSNVSQRCDLVCEINETILKFNYDREQARAEECEKLELKETKRKRLLR